MDKELSLKDLFKVIKKEYWIVVLMILIFTIIGGFYSTYINSPLYQSSSRVIINTDEEFRNTLQVIIEDSVILEKVSRDLNLDRSSETLAEQITVENIGESQVVSIVVVDKDPKLAANIATTTALVFKETMPEIMDFNNIQSSYGVKIASNPIHLLSKGKIASEPINDRQIESILIGCVIGLFAGIGLVLFREFLNDSVKSEDEIEEFLGIPVLGKISKMKKKNLKKINQGKKKITTWGESIGYK